MLKFKKQLVNLKSSVYNLGIVFNANEVQEFLKQNDKRVVLTFENGLKHQGALMPNGNDTWFITINKNLQKKEKIIAGESFTFQMETDASEYGMPFPEEFEITLAQDELANQFFLQQTMGNKRNLIRLVNNVKSSDKRIDKSIIIARYLVNVQGKIDYKTLNQSLKNN